jgi:DNA-binding MurR/RpiR family transcriptional regulator
LASTDLTNSAAAADADRSFPSGATDIIALIRKALPDLPASQRKIAELVLSDPDSILRTNIKDLADQVAVSAPTIVRFARSVGCEGVRDLKLKLAAALAIGTPHLHRSVRPGDGTSAVVENLIGSLIAAIAEWQKSIDPKVIEQVANALNQARRIDCFGTGATSHFLAQDMQARLFRLGLTANAFSDAHFQLVAASSMTSRDVLLAISYIGRMPSLIEAVRLGRERGATVIAMTRAGTPLADLAEFVLPLDVPDDITMRVGTEAYIAQFMLVEILTVVTGLRRDPAVIRHLGQIYHVLQTRSVDSDVSELASNWSTIFGRAK